MCVCSQSDRRVWSVCCSLSLLSWTVTAQLERRTRCEQTGGLRVRSALLSSTSSHFSPSCAPDITGRLLSCFFSRCFARRTRSTASVEQLLVVCGCDDEIHSCTAMSTECCCLCAMGGTGGAEEDDVCAECSGVAWGCSLSLSLPRWLCIGYR